MVFDPVDGCVKDVIETPLGPFHFDNDSGRIVSGSGDLRDLIQEDYFKIPFEKYTMGRLFGSRCYLAGPIDRAADSGAGWRNDIRPELEKLGVNVFDPLHKPINLGLEDDDSRSVRKDWKALEDYDQLAKQMKLIRNVDLRMVDITDFIIANIDMSIPMCGTYEEIFLANKQKKPIIVRCPQGKKALPDWLFGTLPHQMMFGTWDEAIKYIKAVNNREDQRHFKRWFHFDWQKVRGK